MSTEAMFLFTFKTKDGKLRFLFEQPAVLKAYGTRLEGKPLELTIAPAGALKTRLQEKGFHAMIAPWCHEKGHNINDLKTDLLGEILGWSETPSPLTGRRLPLYPHTSTLPRDKYSKLIEDTMEIAARVDGFILEAPHEHRERKAAEAKAQAKREKRKVAA